MRALRSPRLPRAPKRAELAELWGALVRASQNLREVRLLASLATVVLAITLAVVGLVTGLAVQAGRIAAAATPPDQINLYLTKPVTGAERAHLLSAIEDVKSVAATRYLGPEDALEELASGMPEARGWIGALGENPLPATVVATVRRDGDRRALDPGTVVSELAAIPGVAEVQTASEGVSHVVPVLLSVRWTAGVVSMALIAAMLFVVVASFRLTLEPRREEIEILRLNGATERWIRAPLWIEGALLGAVAGTVSAAVAWTCATRLGSLDVPAVITGQTGTLVLDVVPVGVCIGLAVVGPLLGSAGAALATRWALGPG